MNINELREKSIPNLVEVYERIFATSIKDYQAIKDNPAGYCWKDYLAPIADTLPAEVRAIREHYEQTRDNNLLLDLCRAMGAIDVEDCIEHLLKVWKSPVCVTPEAQVPLTLESKFRMTPIKS